MRRVILVVAAGVALVGFAYGNGPFRDAPGVVPATVTTLTVSGVLTAANGGLRIPGANQTATCTANGVYLDTTGTVEICWCSATDTLHCAALGAGTGPAD